MSVKTPLPLKKGDQVAIVCTARAISEEELTPALSWIKSQGYVPVLGNTIGKQDRQFGGTDEVRIEDFQQALDNSNIKAIFCARGGYGTVRLLDGLNFTKFQENPKWIIGFSDVTALHTHIFTQTKIATLHAPLCSTFSQTDQAALYAFGKILRGEQPISYPTTTHPLNQEGEATGILVGGNLSVLYSLLGSNSLPNFNGKILFLEDLDEYLYHIDRMMMGLKRSGVLENLAGLIVGGMTDMNDNKTPFGKTVEHIIADSTNHYNYPICFDFPTGHWSANYPLVHGANTQLMVKENSVNVVQSFIKSTSDI